MKLHAYQDEAVRFALDGLLGRGGAGLFLEPGLGKTIVALKTLEFLETYEGLRRTLVIAPLSVLDFRVWPNEVENWNLPFTTSLVHGTPQQRERALQRDADLYLINPEGIPWLFKHAPLGWQALIVDESTKFKNWSAKRTKALRKMLPWIKYRMILTGTPTPNTLADLFSQIYLLDNGKLLGTTIGQFRRDWMQRGGFEGREWEMRPDRAEALQRLVAPYCLYMDAISHLDMPELVRNYLPVDLPAKAKRIYKQIESEMFAELPDGDLMASSAGAKYLLCRQLANGGAYRYEPQQPRETIAVHHAKVDALANLYEELNGKQLIVAYQFDHDLERIQERFPRCEVVRGGSSRHHRASLLERWQRNEVGLLAVQCQALSHGVDGLQHGGNDLCWFGLTDQPEIHDQLYKRIWRQGAKDQVRIHYLLARGTVDTAIRRRLENKDEAQMSLLQMIKEYQEGENV